MSCTLIHHISAMREASARFRLEGKQIALVPTMGCLHEGHLSLIHKAKQSADIAVTSVFVNPAQFGPAEDFERYPRDIGKDSMAASRAGSDILFAPETSEMYSPGHLTYVDVDVLDRKLEGRSRPGHFRGVATIVAKLFHITTPHVAVFGQKDAQQVTIVRRMAKDLDLNVQIVTCPIVREADGLAMSSRNVYLGNQERREASVLYRSLLMAEARIMGGMMLAGRIIEEMKEMITSESAGEIDYISLADPETLEEIAEIEEKQKILVSLAVRFGNTRLIDNCVVELGNT